MEMRLGIYDVKVSAKQFWEVKGSKKTTLDFLSYLSSALYEASQWNREHGYEATADKLKNEGYQLYRICKEAGLYNDVNK